jgi:hypothetical protein
LIAEALKAITAATRLKSAAQPLEAVEILAFLDTLRSFYGEMQAIAAIPNIATDYPDIAAEAAGVMSATQTLLQWIAVNFPKSNGYLLAQQVDTVTGEVTWRQLSTADLASFRTECAALEATIIT